MKPFTLSFRHLAVLLAFCSLSFLSAQENTYRLLVFEGSDWCANCRRLEKKVLSKELTQAFFEEKGIAVQKVDFPQRKKLDADVLAQNKALAERYGFRGEFPTVLLVKTSSDESQTIPYRNQNPEEFIELVTSAIQRKP